MLVISIIKAIIEKQNANLDQYNIRTTDIVIFPESIVNRPRNDELLFVAENTDFLIA